MAAQEMNSLNQLSVKLYELFLFFNWNVLIIFRSLNMANKYLELDVFTGNLQML